MALALNPDGTLKILEKDVMKAVMDLLLYEEWIVVRAHVGMFKTVDNERTVTMGDEGFPDLLATKLIVSYQASEYPYPLTRSLFIEAKRPKGGRLSTAQRAWKGWLENKGYEYVLGDSVEKVRDYVRGVVAGE